jgi:hypothetical protein
MRKRTATHTSKRRRWWSAVERLLVVPAVGNEPVFSFVERHDKEECRAAGCNVDAAAVNNPRFGLCDPLHNLGELARSGWPHGEHDSTRRRAAEPHRGLVIGRSHDGRPLMCAAHTAVAARRRDVERLGAHSQCVDVQKAHVLMAIVSPLCDLTNDVVAIERFLD